LGFSVSGFSVAGWEATLLVNVGFFGPLAGRNVAGTSTVFFATLVLDISVLDTVVL
jgi:hypothetical protein